MRFVREKEKCLICSNENLNEIINLGLYPFADTFIKKENIRRGEDVYPLIVVLCEDCGNIQLLYQTDPKKRYSSKWNEYSYTMSNSDFSRLHWSQFAKDMIEKIKDLNKEDNIVEIGSNNGFLLKCFKDLGYKNSIGVDPSKPMAKLAKQNGINTIVDLFPLTKFDVGKKYFSSGKFAKLVIANNVLNHSNCPVAFVEEVYKILDDDGVFVFEVLDWLSSFKSFRIDQNYLEHCTNFTTNTCKNLLEKCNMYIDNIEIANYHGGSLRVYAKKNDGIKKHHEKTFELIEKEVRSGMYDKNYYKFFMSHIINQRNRFLKRILDIKLMGGKIIAIGAAAKGNTMLNFYHLDHSLIDYVTDSSSQKQGKYTPLTRIPIVFDEIFANYKKVWALILSWNISTKLKENILKINPNVIFISPDDEDDE